MIKIKIKIVIHHIIVTNCKKAKSAQSSAGYFAKYGADIVRETTGILV